MHVINSGLDKLKPVRMRSGAKLSLEPNTAVELVGNVKGCENASGMRIYPRSEDSLPKGLRVRSAAVVDGDYPRVRIEVANVSRRTVDLKPDTVLAELELAENLSDASAVFEALVGPCCDSSVIVDGVKTFCLIDSGSQVTVISESFYRQHLSMKPLGNFEELGPEVKLRVTGAGGQPVPYLGFVMVGIALPCEIAGTAETIETLALVCPDTEANSRLPVIVGTNTLKMLAARCQAKHGKFYLTSVPIRCEVAFAYKDLNSQDSQGRIGSVRARKKTVIPAGETVEVGGFAKDVQTATRSSVLVQGVCGEDELSKNIRVVAYKVPSECIASMKMFVQNVSENDVILKKNQVFADVFAFSDEYDLQNVVSACQKLLCDDDECEGQTTVNAAQHNMTAAEPREDPSPAMSFQFGEDAPSDWKQHFNERLQSYKDVFIQHEFDIGGVEAETCDVELEPGPPIRERPRPLPPNDLEEVRQHLRGLLDAKIIAPVVSDFSSPIVVVRKKTGGIRMCVDYRRINSRILKDTYAIPKIEDLFLTLNGAQYFSTMDLSKAYYQIPLTERAQRISSFTTPLGTYSWLRMPMGLKNSGSCFQRLMEKVFSDMNLAELIVFLDDILVHGKTLEELEDRTIAALDRLRRFKLKLDPKKCMFGATEIKHLGFRISREGIKPDSEKIKALQEWPRPKTVREVKSFLGFVGFYRRLVPQFAQIARPLYDLTAGYIPAKAMRGKKKKRGEVLSLSSNISHKWKDEHQQAFEKLIQLLTEEPVIGIADKSLPFELRCDASGHGLGAVLCQQQGDKMKIIAYASRGLNKTESHYPAHKREFLALKWALDKFHDYVIGTKVVVYTDNNPLCYVLKSAKLDATSHRWLAGLSVYDLEIRFKRGALNVDADTLSRLPQGPVEEDEEYQKTKEKIDFFLSKARPVDEVESERVTIQQATVQAVCEAHGIIQDASFGQQSAEEKRVPDIKFGNSRLLSPAVEQLIANPDKIPEDILEPDVVDKLVTQEEWRKLQRADKNIAIVIDHMESGRKLDPVGSPELGVFAREREKLYLREGVLYRKTTDFHDQPVHQLVIPTSHRKEALKGVHEDLFHTNFEDAIRQARKRFFWPFMSTDLKRKIEKCLKCKRSKARQQKAPMCSIVTTYPLELLSIDFLTIDVKGEKQNMLVVMDHFTKFAQAFPTKDQTAKTVARVLWNDFFLVYGYPSRILSDQGRDFESKLVKEVCTVAGISKCRTTSFHPQSNPVERWNRTLIGMLRTLEDEQKKDWRKYLRSVVHAYNSCIHESTGFSPYYLFFGRHPRLPVDAVFGINLNGGRRTTRQYVKDLKGKLQEAYGYAAEQMRKKAGKNKARYDARACAGELEPGDRVLVKNLGPRIFSKVADRWERHIYTVIRKAEGVPVYVVRPEAGGGPERTLHRNVLFPVGMIGDEMAKEIETGKVKCPNRQRLKISGVDDGTDSEDESLHKEIVIKIEVDPVPAPTVLRPEVPEFVPAVQVPVEEEFEEVEDGVDAEHNQRDSEEEVEMDETATVSEAENARNVEPEQREEGEDGETSTGAESAQEDVVEEEPVLRRSARIRRPVNRFNLAHQCEPNTPESTLNCVQRIRNQLKSIFGSNSEGSELEKVRSLCCELYEINCALRNLYYGIWWQHYWLQQLSV